MSTPKNGPVWSCAIDYGVITGTGAHLELVNGSQWIDTGHSAIFQTENDRFVILSCIAHILTHQHEIGLERSATYKWNERRKWYKWYNKWYKVDDDNPNDDVLLPSDFGGVAEHRHGHDDTRLRRRGDG